MHWTITPLADDQLVIAVRAEMEQTSGRALSVSNSLPRELIATAQIEGIPLSMLDLWIHADKGEDGWSAPAFAQWAREIERMAIRYRDLILEARP